MLYVKLLLGRSGYDIVVPSANWANMEIGAGLLKKIDKSKLPNLVNLDPSIVTRLARLDPGNEHLVPWLWGYTSVAINTGKVKAALGDLPMPANPWDLVFDVKYVARLKSCGVSFLDTPSEVLPPALAYVGKYPFSNTASDYDLAERMLQKIRPYVTLFSTTGYINDMANGELCVAIAWSGDMNKARRQAIALKNGNDIVTLIPKRGSVLSYEAMAIPIDAPHPENALLWMNYILRAQVQAEITNKVSFASPNLASRKFIRKELLEDKTLFLPDADRQNMTTVEPLNSSTRHVANRVYTKFKAGI
jgi:putrescine transport system substrate-binding protein